MRPPVHRLLGSHALAAIALSLPWPWLLVLVWESTHDPALLGVAAASRMLPYVLCSWWAARVGDRLRRDRVVRATVVARLVLLSAVPLAVALGQLGPAVALASLAVAVATPAYPALAAAMPDAAGEDAARATDLLVTIEVASFVVGPAFGGLLLATPSLVAPISVGGTAAALVLLAGVELAPARRRTTRPRGATWAAVRDCAPVRRSLLLVSVLNLVVTAVGVTLLLMARGPWAGWWAPDSAYGVASGALGFGALAAPTLTRCGRTPWARARSGVLLVSVAVGLVAISPTALWALLPLLLVGAAAVHAESAATAVVQAEADDDVRATLFGLADSCMVGAAMLGALVAPAVAELIGTTALLAALAALALVISLLTGLPWKHPRPQRVPATTVPPISSSVSTPAVSPARANSSSVRSA